ncbi:glycosyltransferase involved in cell wall biosynthesis [Silvimonas terrae]|uniref:Glycosyltransferase involved in cell wall biosynthesis n=1 Tax=Silvimonas terrae TaxID=300266 RepID=A0A840RJH3_9NEIS|nr:glycosyl transferase [Silvimonas terrae]MBB5192456.1 glycosyltransferase involved in cell wall biosynthesis [Silvimonas terrae]
MKLIYFAPVPFDSYWQRPHYMVRYLLENGFDQVTWVNPYPTRLPVLSDLKARTGKKGGGLALAGVQVLRPRALPVEPLPLMNQTNRLLWRAFLKRLTGELDRHTVIGVGRPSRLALTALRAAPAATTTFLDVMDDFSAFYRGLSRRSMRHVEAAVAHEVQHIWCSAPGLLDKYRSMVGRQDIELVPNGYDMRRLPAPLRAGDGRPVIGFVGSIASWFDWELVIAMAKALPETTIRLIGPVFGHLPYPLPANIEMLGECNVDEAIGHIRQFHVGIIPFRRNQLTHSVDPIKFYEMRAMGVPVWSTDFGTMSARLQHGEALTMSEDADWPALLTQSLASVLDEAAIEQFRHEHDWAHRFAHMGSRLTAAAGRVR